MLTTALSLVTTNYQMLTTANF